MLQPPSVAYAAPFQMPSAVNVLMISSNEASTSELVDTAPVETPETTEVA